MGTQVPPVAGGGVFVSGDIDFYEKRGILNVTTGLFLKYGQEESQMPEREIGKVTDYFARPVVAGVRMEGPLDIGERVHIMGHTTDFELTVSSMQIDHHYVSHANIGEDIGIKVPDRVRTGDKVYKID